MREVNTTSGMHFGSAAASNVNSMRNALLMNFYVEFRICKQRKENSKSAHCITSTLPLLWFEYECLSLFSDAHNLHWHTIGIRTLKLVPLNHQHNHGRIGLSLVGIQHIFGQLWMMEHTHIHWKQQNTANNRTHPNIKHTYLTRLLIRNNIPLSVGWPIQ